MRAIKIFRTNPSFYIMRLIPYQFSTESQPKVLLLRHGKTFHNQLCDQFGKDLDINWQRPLKDDQYCQKGPYNLCQMDSSLTPEGQLQCRKISEVLRSRPFDLVLVSPMFRTLQTCSIVFKGRQIPIKVEPLLAQAYRYSCDLIPEGKTKQKHEMFKNFDFSEDYQPEYFYHFSADKINFLEKHFRWNQIVDIEKQRKQIMKLIRYHTLMESDCEVRLRAKKFKLKLDQIIKENNYKNICVISHFHLIGFLLAKKFGIKNQILDFEDIKNCEPCEKNLSQFLSIM